MKEVLFIRNSPVLIFHDFTIKNKKEIVKVLKDLNLSITKNFDWLERDSFIIYIHLFKNLLSYPKILNYYKPSKNEVQGYKYVGSKAVDLLFLHHRIHSINLIICQNSNVYETYKVNKLNILIDLDSEHEIFTDDEVRRLLSYSNKDIQNIQKNENVNFIDGYIYDEEVITPISLKYKGNKTIIGFFHFSKISWKPMIILHLKENILKDRNVLGKLLCYFINIESLDIHSGYRDKWNVYINFNKRKRKELVSYTINVDHEVKYDNIFNNIKIGSDFEFCFSDEYGENVFAYNVIESYIKYYFLYDDEREYERELSEMDCKRKIGVDGDHRIGECRTEVYNADENGYREFIEEIKDLIFELKKYADHSGCLITFSSEKLPIGAHLHMGFDFDEKRLVVPNFALLLDLSLGSYLVTLNTQVRLDTRYAEYNNCEMKSYGFEYRSIPATIFFNGLYKYVIEIYYKLIKYYFYKSYVIVELDSDGKLSKKFFEKLLGKNTKKYFKLINELRDSLHKKILYLEYPSLNAKTLLVKENSLYNHNDYFKSKFEEFMIDLNLNYVKNGIVHFYGLRRERGDNITTLDKTFEDLPKSSYYYSNIPYLEDFYIVEYGISRNLREAEGGEEMYCLSEAIYKLLKHLEKENKLIKKSESIFRELSEKYGFNVEVIEKAVV